MLQNDFAHYGELVSAWFAEGSTCLTWSDLPDFGAVVRAFGADPDSGEAMNVEDAQIEQYDADIPGVLPVLVAGEVGRWTLVVEPNGAEGTRPEVLRVLAAEGRAVSVLLNGPNADLLSYAAAGAPVIAHNLGAESGEDLAALPIADAASIMVAAGDNDRLARQAAALVLAERITGERLTEEWLLDTSHIRLLVASPLSDDIVPEQYRDHPILQDPEISAIVRDPSLTAIPRIRYLLVRSVVQGSELGHPSVEEALAVLSNEDADTAGQRIRARRHIWALRDDLRCSSRPQDALRLRAAEVVLHGLESDLVDSSRKVAEHAYMGHLTDAQKATVVILGNCLRRILG
ncbi:hypothetical protein GCM10010517_47300 [Streptosporangium fragile]|uniref:Uncharacterized protein n=1 Tax=Streptosporangium fragile TaxID=46186 RepID=A0ABN3W304_9ACTN